MTHGKRYTTSSISPFGSFETSISSGNPNIDKRLETIFGINFYGEPLNSEGKIAGGRAPGYYIHNIPRRA